MTMNALYMYVNDIIHLLHHADSVSKDDLTHQVCCSTRNDYLQIAPCQELELIAIPLWSHETCYKESGL